MAYDLHFNNNGFVLIHKGIITISEIHEANGRIQGHQDFDLHTHQIIDLLQADFSNITQKKADEPAATDWVASRLCPTVKIAIVVDEERAVAFSQQYIDKSIKMESPWHFSLFTEMQEALKWVLI